jgi:P pilus assembly chaperone PapD
MLFSSKDSERRLLIVNNDSHAPVLLQSWIDDGSAGDVNKEKNYPFAVIPAVARMTPGKILNLKILPTEKLRDLPRDRESLFWINLYEIPAVKKSELGGSSRIEIGLNTQIKIIYRPFKGSMDIKTIAEAIKIRVTNDGHSIEMDNPSPYFVTPVSVKIKSSSGEQLLKLGMNRMISPFGHKNFILTTVMNKKNMIVEYTLVDDAGKDVSFKRTLN